jgi:hypothetical protein
MKYLGRNKNFAHDEIKNKLHSGHYYHSVQTVTFPSLYKDPKIEIYRKLTDLLFSVTLFVVREEYKFSLFLKIKFQKRLSNRKTETIT